MREEDFKDLKHHLKNSMSLLKKDTIETQMILDILSLKELIEPIELIYLQ
jgi:hypothetical protein